MRGRIRSNWFQIERLGFQIERLAPFIPCADDISAALKPQKKKPARRYKQGISGNCSTNHHAQCFNSGCTCGCHRRGL